MQRRTVSVRRTQGERVEYNCYEEVESYKSIPFSDIVKVAQRRAHVSKADTSRMSHSETAPKKSAQLSYHENIMCLYEFLRGKGYGGNPLLFQKKGVSTVNHSVTKVSGGSFLLRNIGRPWPTYTVVMRGSASMRR